MELTLCDAELLIDLIRRKITDLVLNNQLNQESAIQLDDLVYKLRCLVTNRFSAKAGHKVKR